MKSFIAIAVLSLASVTALAQTGGVPPEQAPAGEPGKFRKPTAKVAPAADTTDTTAAKPMSKGKSARKAKREAKVGDKPLN